MIECASLDSKVALVTGAARGIGEAVARTLARHGADVVVTDLAANADLLDSVAREIQGVGRKSLVCTADLTRKTEVNSLVAATTAHFGRLDILVNNAGVHLYPSPLLTVTEAEWDRVFDVNVKGALFTCQAALPEMIQRCSGVIVNVASDSAFDIIPDEGPYGITKIAVVRISSYLARELAGKGIRVNSIAPGWVRTRLTEHFWNDPTMHESIVNSIPSRRIASPDDIAGVVLFLASDLANYVNGHCIVVDGGRIAGIPG